MNKFYDNGESLPNDLEYTKRLENVKKKLAEQMRQEFSLNSRTSEPMIIKKDKFCNHPRNCSGSDTTVSNSPRKSNYSCNSNINLEFESLARTNQIIYGNSHKKFLTKWTNHNRPSSEHQRIEVDIGDSFDNTPTNSYRVTDIKEELKTFYNKYKHKNSSVATNVQSGTEEVQKIASKIMSDSTFEKKFKSFVEKSLQSISDIIDLLDKGIEPPDGDEDMSRRILRVKEFSNRFSRNYLYPLVRQVDELSKWRSIHPGSNQKLLSAYQIIFNGLQAYQNHLPSSIGACSSDKLKLLMKHLLDLCDIHYKLLSENDEFGCKEFLITFRLNAELTLTKIENHFTTHFSGRSTSVRLNTSQYRSDSKVPKQKKPKSNLHERLYMYNTTCSFRKDILWKKAAEAMARDKNKNIKSRYKTAGFKHRPPIARSKSEMFHVPNIQSKISSKKFSSIFKKQPSHITYNEDDIATMIQIEDEKNKNNDNDGDGEKQDENKQVPVNNEEIVVKLLQLLLDIKARKKDNNSEENLKRNQDAEKILEILEKMKKGADFDSMKDLLKELQSGNACRETLELKIIQSSESFPNISARPKKEPTVTVSGAKNAKLICIKDDNSIIETDIDDIKDDKQAEKKIPVKNSPSHNPPNTPENNSLRPSTSLSMKRSSKFSKYLQTLPKDYAVNIIQYKIDFTKHCKKNPMYKRTTHILPWVMMAHISDKILNLVLLGAAKEVEVSQAVENIYQSELQIF